MIFGPSWRFSYRVTIPDGLEDRGNVSLRAQYEDWTGPSLVGPEPNILLRPDYIGFEASDRSDATVRTFWFNIGDALQRAMQPGDMLYLARTWCGCNAVSLLREGSLLVAFGAATGVPLGEVSLKSSLERVEFECGGAVITLREREAGRVGPYDVYVEALPTEGTPGTEECVAIARMDVPTLREAAQRSSILCRQPLGQVTRWEEGRRG